MLSIRSVPTKTPKFPFRKNRTEPLSTNATQLRAMRGPGGTNYNRYSTALNESATPDDDDDCIDTNCCRHAILGACRVVSFVPARHAIVAPSPDRYRGGIRYALLSILATQQESRWL
mmetsp:Transcript_16839/g.35137  ORF Transcript_16839/g.35137 Transcript_16839/m.35137 type:complete len:117 (-) Transcript_16839:355-705(-)